MNFLIIIILLFNITIPVNQQSTKYPYTATVTNVVVAEFQDFWGLKRAKGYQVCLDGVNVFVLGRSPKPVEGDAKVTRHDRFMQGKKTFKFRAMELDIKTFLEFESVC